MSEFRFTRNLNKKVEAKKDPDYVPPPAIDKKYPGMRKKVKTGGMPKKPDVKYSDLKPFEGRPSPNLSQAQLNRFDKFIKLKPDETKEEWEYRTRNWRVRTDDEIKELPKLHKLSITIRKKKRKDREYQNKYIRPNLLERDFDFMKYYSIVANFYSIKYGIRKDDIEVGFHFYDGIPFTRSQFENIWVLTGGCASGRFNRFRNSGLLEDMTIIERKFQGKNISKPSGLFKLSKGFIRKLGQMYSVLGRMNTIRMYHEKAITPLNDELRNIIHDMNLEIIEIQKGKKPRPDFLEDEEPEK